MRLINTRPVYRCDFCRFRATAPTVEKHEKICWLNPNRFCPLCKNKGYIEDVIDEGLIHKEPCHYCSKFTTKEQWEAGLGAQV